METKPNPHSHLKLKIAVSGAADTSHCGEGAIDIIKEVGREIARRGAVLVTGATTGAPYWAAIGAKEEGGFVIGLSPASTEIEHVKKYRLPLDYHDLIVYTGFGYSGRNLLLTRASDAVITINGRVGTLNEFTIAFEDRKPQGVLLGSGGMSDMLQEILGKAHRGTGKTVFESNPKTLLDKIVALIEAEEEEINGSEYISSRRARG